MSGGKATIGVDFGTESARAVLVDVVSGRELATAVHRFRSGVIDQQLPGGGTALPSDWALQDPDDYLEALGETVRAVLAESRIDVTQVIGIGIDFTACTMLPVTADGTPLSRESDLRQNPHAWVKLWKHHAAQPEADLINEMAAKLGEPWLDRYGRRTSSEWFYAKSLQILNEAPEVYERADRLIEAADWVVWQLTGVETRNSCTAGYKAFWSKQDGFPDREFFASLAPGFADVVDDKMSRDVSQRGRASRCNHLLSVCPHGAGAGDASGDRQCRCPCVGSGRNRCRARPFGGSDGHQHLSSRLGRGRSGGAWLLWRRRGRSDPRNVWL